MRTNAYSIFPWPKTVLQEPEKKKAGKRRHHVLNRWMEYKIDRYLEEYRLSFRLPASGSDLFKADPTSKLIF